MFDYQKAFEENIDKIKREGRYRKFTPIERNAQKFPKAFLVAQLPTIVTAVRVAGSSLLDTTRQYSSEHINQPQNTQMRCETLADSKPASIKLKKPC